MSNTKILQRQIEEHSTTARESFKGKSIERLEDPRFLEGEAKFIDDLKLPEQSVFAAYLRSPYAHAIIKSVNVERAMRMPGVVAVVTGQDALELTKSLGAIPIPGRHYKEYCMAVDKCVYEGQIVAAVAATDRYTAEDALELLEVQYESLQPILDPQRAAESNENLLFPETGTNVVWEDVLDYGQVDEAFKNAEIIVSDSFTVHRYASTPIERLGIAVKYNKAENKLTIWSNNQMTGRLLTNLSAALTIPEQNIRLIMPDIGGSYGNKQSPRDTLVAILLAIRSERLVKYVMTERESMAALTHASNGKFYVEAAANKDGIISALRTKEFIDEGGSSSVAGMHVTTKMSISTGCYKIPNLRVHAYSVLTNKCPAGPNRGVGKPATAFIVERIVDRVAQKLGMDRAEVRFRNFIQPHEFPYESPTGNVYDSGDYPKCLKLALEKIDYENLKMEKQELRRKGRYIGVGIASVVHSSTALSFRGRPALPIEAATVKMDASGKVTVAIGSPTTGQGHETTVAQVVADELGIALEDVHFQSGFDSETHPWTRFGGRFSNKFSSIEIGAIYYAANRLKEKILRIAAIKLNANLSSGLDVTKGKISVRGNPKESVSIKEVADFAYNEIEELPQDLRSGLVETYLYQAPFLRVPDKSKKFRSHLTYAYSVHIPVVEVDVETGKVKILRYVAIEDGGRIINPLLVDGQIHGSSLHGISGALQEEFSYDEDGHLLASTFMDYVKPSIADATHIELFHMNTPSPFTPLGSKGIGDGSAVPPLAALASAVEDALEPFGAKINSLPLSPINMWSVLRKVNQ